MGNNKGNNLDLLIECALILGTLTYGAIDIYKVATRNNPLSLRQTAEEKLNKEWQNTAINSDIEAVRAEITIPQDAISSNGLVYTIEERYYDIHSNQLTRIIYDLPSEEGLNLLKELKKNLDDLKNQDLIK